MVITLNESEIEQAIRVFCERTIPDYPDHAATVEVSASTGGVTATVEFTMEDWIAQQQGEDEEE